MIYYSHDICSNIWHLLSSAIALYLKPVIMNYYMIRYSFVYFSLSRGVPSWVRMLL